MKATLKLHAIGENKRREFEGWLRSNHYNKIFTKAIPPPCWVAEVTMVDGVIVRNRLPHTTDYSFTNGTGSRGTYLWYILESGKIYEVNERVSWSRSERYFISVDEQGDFLHMSQDEVRQCLKERCSE